MSDRSMIFLSHANPEDNGFTQWLALRLARDGYPVWCDLAKLLGGEDFWQDAEIAIREHSSKFIFILSSTSNRKPGVLQELAVATAVAKKLGRFILPLRIDDIPFDEVNIELKRLTAIDFSQNWVSGYSQLLERLEQDKTPKHPAFTPDAVSLWWQDHFGADDGVQPVPEEYVSNEFLLDDLPPSVHLIYLDNPERLEDAVLDTPFPVYRYRSFLVSFAPATELSASLASSGLTVRASDTTSLDSFLQSGYRRPRIDRRTAQNVCTHLLQSAIASVMQARDLLPYSLSNRRTCFWFPQNVVQGDKVSFLSLSGKKQWRSLVGYKSLSSRPGESPQIRNWHYAAEVRIHLHPQPMMVFLPHVVFSQDGVPYDSSQKQHSARRSQCKDWWNDAWLDRMLALMAHLSGGQEALAVPANSDAAFSVAAYPCRYESPVSFSKRAASEADASLDSPEDNSDEREDEPNTT